MPSPSDEVVYRDFDFRFAAHPVTGRLAMLKNGASVRQAVRMLLSTNPGERPFRPTLGSGVRAQLFEHYTTITEAAIKRQIRVAVENHEPRAELLKVAVSKSRDGRQMSVDVVFRPTNQTDPETATVALERVR